MGKSPWLQSVVVDIEESLIQKYIGNIVNVKIIKSRPSSLIAEII